jgi:hypothetical protein
VRARRAARRAVPDERVGDEDSAQPRGQISPGPDHQVAAHDARDHQQHRLQREHGGPHPDRPMPGLSQAK